MNRRSHRAFSLIELLTVIAILAIISGLVIQVFLRVSSVNHRAGEELLSLSAMEIFQQRFTRDVRETSNVHEWPPPTGGGQAIQVGDVLYTVIAPSDATQSWKLERRSAMLAESVTQPLGGPPLKSRSPVARLSLGQKVSSIHFDLKQNGAGRVNLVVLTIKITPAGGGKTSQREFVFAAHPRA